MSSRDEIYAKLRDLPRFRVKRAKGHIYHYYVVRDDEGKQRLKPLDRNPTRALAQYYELERADHAPPNKVSWMLTEFEADFLGDAPGEQGSRSPKALSEKTRYEYRNQIPRLNAAFGKMITTEVRQHHIAAYLEQHPSPVSANREIALLSRIYTWGLRRGWAMINPCLRVEKNAETQRTRYISDAEFLARRQSIGPLGAEIMNLGYLTGLRLGDLCSILLGEPADGPETYAWLAADAIYVKPAKTRKRVQRTLRFPRDDALGPVVERLLALRVSRPVSSMHLITNRYGRPVTLSGFTSMWRRAAQRDQIDDFLWIDIRAKAATDADERGHNAQLLLGHTTSTTTDRYLRGRRVMDVHGPGNLPEQDTAEIVPIVPHRNKN